MPVNQEPYVIGWICAIPCEITLVQAALYHNKIQQTIKRVVRSAESGRLLLPYTSHTRSRATDLALQILEHHLGVLIETIEH